MSECPCAACRARSEQADPPEPPQPIGDLPKRSRYPQKAVDQFWTKYTTKTPTKVSRIIPQNQYADKVAAAQSRSKTSLHSVNAETSYEEAAALCRVKVGKIVKECRRVNKKYRDPHFDITIDLKFGFRDCLEPLVNDRTLAIPGRNLQPKDAKRVTEIFDNPQFYINGASANDIRQGNDGDCWLMAALCTLSNKPGLIEKLCVARDQDVGVYGFVFYRDGEWISEIVDDYLYLTKGDYDENFIDRVLFDELERNNPEDAYRRIYQSNSTALYFAQCEHPQETWLPLLEKAYAKAHGDYASIEGGLGGEGIEDLTGGVTTEISTSDILDKDYFWSQLLKVNDEFLFNCSTGIWPCGTGNRVGIIEKHAYSVQKAVEIDGQRLVRVRNPWGRGEWKGPWSDGSKEWTVEWLQKLEHQFGDDGNFWISYHDLLRKYQFFDRTRLFDKEWSVSQIWTTLAIPWLLDYHDTHFRLKITQSGPVVIVLSQLDDRYFRGLQGPYRFDLGLRLHKVGEEDYIVRSEQQIRTERSVNVELDLEEGEYDVRIKIDTNRDNDVLPAEQVVRENSKKRRDKLMRIGLAYDLAHSKGKVIETEQEKASREAHLAKKKNKTFNRLKKELIESRMDAHYMRTRDHARAKRKSIKAREKAHAKVALRHQKRKQKKEARKKKREEKEVDQDEESDESEEDSDDDDSDDVSSVATLSDIDERETSIRVNTYKEERDIHDTSDEESGEDDVFAEEDAETRKNPWNPLVVVGLRVYHKAVNADGSNGTVSMRVIRPDPYAEPGSVDAKTKALDVDDSARDALTAADAKNDSSIEDLGDALKESLIV